MTTRIFDAAQTARLTPYALLVDALKVAAADYAQGRIASPERLVVPLNAGGVMLSMPATASDLAIHKLVSVCPTNRVRALPTIHGLVMASNADTGETRFILDGPTVTGRRTAAMTMLGIQTFLPAAPRDVLLIGAGMQSGNHLEAIAELFPDAQIRVRGSAVARAQAFCDAHRVVAPRVQPALDTHVPDSVDLVITLTTSKIAVYHEAPRADRLVIGVGAFTPDAVEIGARTVLGSALFVDDLAGAKHEAGDFIQAGVDWNTVTAIASVLGKNTPPVASGTPVVFKTVGCAAWDLAACRVARAALGDG